MVATEDGFAIAEKDLEIRGPGDFFGTRQWGMPSFRVAHLLRDRELLEPARREAFQLVAEHGDALPAPLPESLRSRTGRLTPRAIPWPRGPCPRSLYTAGLL
jgi:ATP-dependent DNA helicase RecG